MAKSKMPTENLLQRVRGSFVYTLNRYTVANGSPINIMPDPKRVYLAFFLQTTTDNVSIQPYLGSALNFFDLGSQSQTWMIEFPIDKCPSLCQTGWILSTIGFNVPVAVITDNFGS